MVRVRVSFGIVIALAIASAGHVRAQPDEAALDRAADRVMSRKRYQELPTAEKAGTGEKRPGNERKKPPRRGDRDYSRDDYQRTRAGNPNAGLAPNCRGDQFIGAENGASDGDTINLFNPPSCAPDFTKNYNVTAIVLNVPIAQLGGTIFDTWSTISVLR